MQQIALKARVVCTDGPAGHCTHLVFHPATRTLTHFVVSGEKDGQDRLVPVERIVESGESVISLDCTVQELASMPAFSGHEYVTYAQDDAMVDYMAGGGYGYMGDPYMMPVYTPVGGEVVHEQIPEGLRAIRYGARVEATDGSVGLVDQLLLDPATNEITHFTLQEGHFWGKKKSVTLPISAVDHTEEDVIYLRLNKQAISVLPALPIRKRDDKGNRRGGIELIAKVFDSPDKAAEELTFVHGLQRAQHGALKVRSAAIIVKDASGKVTVKESHGFSPRRGGWMGAVAGGLLGALAGPVGIAIGAAAGAGIGHAAPKWIDLGLPDEFLNRLQAHLTPSSSALVLVVEHHYLQSLAESLDRPNGILLQHTLTDEVVEELLREQEK
jgi:uncharacterized membrane protein